ncbi:MAG: hypothetical protein H0U17_05715 [Actinobacteria bacterium]|nr:hypothetical protein [Actinomycetota bacterium]
MSESLGSRRMVVAITSTIRVWRAIASDRSVTSATRC